MKIPGSAIVKTLTISSTQTVLYNARTAYLAAGYPASPPVRLKLLVAGRCQAGIDEGAGWPSGTIITIQFSGGVGSFGVGGAGGNGGRMWESGGNHYSTAPGGGQNGGDSLILRAPTILDVSDGYIYAGAGGGGGGGASTDPSWFSFAIGSGAGGAIGYNNPAGGLGGAGGYGAQFNGTAGSSAAPGVTGAYYYGQYSGQHGGHGGSGGTWAAAGAAGEAGVPGLGGPYQFGAAGGAAGYAIRRNGNALDITGGNDATHIKGTVA